MLTGNVVSLVLGGLICYVWSMIAPENYDFVSMRQIRMVEDEDADSSLGFSKVHAFANSSTEPCVRSQICCASQQFRALTHRLS